MNKWTREDLTEILWFSWMGATIVLCAAIGYWFSQNA